MISKKVSHYHILEKLGEGGMGVVYKARDTKLDRLVAVKFLPHHLVASEGERARFLQEARAASALNHPNVCTIHDIAQEGDEQFIVMEYVDGSTLRKALPVPKVQDALTYAVQIADALTEAHGKGIVHRDIKSENIMVNRKNQIKVMDFGLAKLKGSLKLTKSSSTIGTLAYMAPEQIQGGEVDARSDIFSFGVLLFEMLTGHLPFRGEHEAAMMYSILNEEPEPVRRARQEISPEIEHIILRALEKDPEDRYQTVADMAGELRREQKKSARVVRPSQDPTLHSAATVLRPILPEPVRRSRKKFLLSAGVGLGVVVFALLVYLLSGHRQSMDSLAVMPFENVGADPNTEYLSDGITESIISTLSRLSGLSVMSRTSVFHYKGKDVDPLTAGKELGVEAVLVGRVTQRGDNLQISVELVNVSSRSQIWGEQYSKKMADILLVQQDIAKAISRQLRVKLAGGDEEKLGRRSTEDTEAYQLYLKGRFHWNKRTSEELLKAVDYFNGAIEQDPRYAVAYAGLALTYVILPCYGSFPAGELVPKVEKAAKRALELDPTLAEPHAALAYMKHMYQYDWDGADKEYLRAIELEPNSSISRFWHSTPLSQVGRLEESLAEVRRAQEIDPLSLIIGAGVGEALYYLNRFDESRAELQKVLDLDPTFAVAHQDLGELYARQNRLHDALPEYLRARELVGANDPFLDGDIGYTYGVLGQKAEAMKILKRLIELCKNGKPLAVQVAAVYTGMGEKEKAFEWLQKGFGEQNYELGFLKIGFKWKSLRADPRYTILLRKIGLEL